MGPENKEQTPKTGCLPVTSEAAKKALDEIAQDAAKVFFSEANIIMKDSPAVNGLINILQVGLGDANGAHFLEGAVFAYKIIRANAELEGLTIPNVSLEQTNQVLYENIQYARSQSKNLDLDVLFELQFNKVAEKDKAFGDAIKEIAKYSTIKSGIYGGASYVYKAIAKATN